MEDIAIVGMACLFPGAPDIETFWGNIVDKKSAISDPPPDWGGEFSFDPDSKENDRVYCVKGGYLGDLSRFDPLKYGIMPNAVDGAEPEHFLALKVAYDAFADAGYPDIPINKDRTEVILGRGTYVNRALMSLHQHGFVIHQTLRLLKDLHPEYTDEDLEQLRAALKRKLPPFDAYTAPGIVSSIMSGRIANRLDLKGANYTIDAACASSILAIEHAAEDLRSGKCDVALAGGVQLSANNLVLMVFSQLGALSKSGTLMPFDCSADGTMLGEGVGMVVLKRRADAEVDGSRIYALIKGVGSSSDGRAKSVVAPRLEGEELAMRRAYEEANIPPSTIDLIEAHGTGIPLGDATEIEALSRVFGSGKNGNDVAIGTVKSMIGHLIPASGIAGIIKTALALHHRVLPPTICERPNPDLNLDQTPFYINTEPRPWINGNRLPRRAGINAFGFGGINSHAILEEYEGGGTGASTGLMTRWDSELFVISGDTREEIVNNCSQVLGFLERMPDVELKDLAFTLNSDVRGRPYRLSVVAGSVQDLAEKLTYSVRRLKDDTCRRIRDRKGIFFFEDQLAKEGKLAFLFPGEGSQYVNMLADLCMHFPEVRSCFDLVDRVFKEEMGYPLGRKLFPPPSQDGRAVNEEEIWQMEVAVQAVTAANRALCRLLSELQIVPDSVMGHSSGEFAALEAAGAIVLENDEDVATYMVEGIKSVRGVASASEQIEEVRLIAVGAQDRSVLSKIMAESNGSLVVAMDNCPHQTVICGDRNAMDKAVQSLQQEGAAYSLLPFHRAYHTPRFDSACEPLRVFFDSIRLMPPRVPVYSCAYVGMFPETKEGVREYAINQWKMAVRFRETIEHMYDTGTRLFIEVGPGANLTSFVNDILGKRQFVAASVNSRHSSGITSLHHALGLMISHGVDADLGYLYSRRSPRKVVFEPMAEPHQGKREPRLRLTLPMMYLDGEEVGNLRRGHSGNFGSHPALSAGPAIISDTHAEDVPHAPGQKIRHAPRTMDDRSSRTQVMSEFLHTQKMYLESHGEVMRAYLNRTRRRDIGQPTGHTASKVRKRHPFIGTVIVKKPGEKIVMRRDLDLSEDLFLRDHVLAGKVSMIDKELQGLPVMPFTMSIEMMAEAACELVPGKVLTCMRNVRAYRWIAILDASVTLEATAELISDKEVRVEMRDANNGSSPGLPLLEGLMIFSDSYPEARVASAFTPRDAVRSRFTEENMYATGMFSGPSFQGVASIDEWGSDGATATLKALPADTLFRSEARPEFAADPVVLDAVGQVAAHWNAEVSSAGFNFFPYLMEEMVIFGPSLSYPHRVRCNLRIEKLSEGTFRSDMDVVGPDGRLFMQIRGWEDKSFDLPQVFYMIRSGQPDVPASSRWDVQAEGLGAQGGYECRRIAGFPVRLLLDHGKIWLHVLARQLLSKRERMEWKQSTANDKRRVEWLLGRCAAKDAVVELLKRRYGLSLCPADIDIRVDEFGKPVVSGEWIGRLENVPEVTIAHSKGMVAALAVDDAGIYGAGIDVESLRPLGEGVADSVFSGSEMDLMKDLEVDGRDEWILRLWCAKEAAAKALGTGLAGDPKKIVVKGLDIDTGVVFLEAAEGLRAMKPEIEGVCLNTTTFVEGDTITAISACRRRQVDA